MTVLRFERQFSPAPARRWEEHRLTVHYFEPLDFGCFGVAGGELAGSV
ncbi:MAG: hypothetical protein QM744_00710 [Mesorhizobium sp.]